MKKLFLLIIVVTLNACGNAERGAIISSTASSSADSISRATHITFAPSDSSAQFNACYPATIYIFTTNGQSTIQDRTIGDGLSGLAICPSTTHASIVKIRAGSLLPDTQKVCLIPEINGVMKAETCLAVADEQQVKFVDRFVTRVNVVYESDLSEWKNYYVNRAFFGAYFPPVAVSNIVFASGAQ